MCLKGCLKGLCLVLVEGLSFWGLCLKGCLQRRVVFVRVHVTRALGMPVVLSTSQACGRGGGAEL